MIRSIRTDTPGTHVVPLHNTLAACCPDPGEAWCPRGLGQIWVLLKSRDHWVEVVDVPEELEEHIWDKLWTQNQEW